MPDQRARSGASVRLVGAATIALLAVAVCAPIAGALDAAGGSASPIVLREGDSVSVAGTDIACVVRTRGGVKGLDCETRAARSSGALGARVSENRLAVFQFTGKGVARTIFSASHDGKARRLTTCSRR